MQAPQWWFLRSVGISKAFQDLMHAPVPCVILYPDPALISRRDMQSKSQLASPTDLISRQYPSYYLGALLANHSVFFSRLPINPTPPSSTAKKPLCVIKE